MNRFCFCAGHTVRHMLSNDTHLATMRVLTVLRHWVTKHTEVGMNTFIVGLQDTQYPVR